MNNNLFNVRFSGWLKTLLGLVLVVILGAILSVFLNLKTAKTETPFQPSKQPPITQQSIPTPMVQVSNLTNQPSPSQKNTTPPAQPSATDPTVRWKEHVNSVYGYSIKYPPDWSIRDFGSMDEKTVSYVAVNPTPRDDLQAVLGINVSNGTYDEEVLLSRHEGVGTIKTEETFTIYGITGRKSTGGELWWDNDQQRAIEQPVTKIIVPSSKYVFVIVLHPSPLFYPGSDYSITLEKMLGSFKLY